MFYTMTIAGLERRLPMFPVNEQIQIAALNMFGDVELTEACARDLLRQAPEFDCIFTAEAKSIPLAYAMARQSGKTYFIARKRLKVYMKDAIEIKVVSITTKGEQMLYVDGGDANAMKGLRVLVVDDVISTGQTLKALAGFVDQVGATPVAQMAVLAEGEAAERTDIITLGPLPLFDAQGNALPY